MASNLNQRPLAAASQRVIDAILKLESAVDLVAEQQGLNVQDREKLQSELTASWQSHTAGIEANLQSAKEENSELKRMNISMANELNQLKQQYHALQQTAGKVAQRLDQSIEQIDLLMESA